MTKEEVDKKAKDFVLDAKLNDATHGDFHCSEYYDGIVKGYLGCYEQCAKDNDALVKEIDRLKDTILSLGKIINENKEKWKYLESRFVKVDYCNDDQRSKCPLFPMECEGNNCKSFVDLIELLEKSIDSGLVH